MIVVQVAIVSETKKLKPSELTRVAAALQKQAVRDFAPIWEVRATVDPFVQLDDVPLGYWPIIVRDDIEFDGAAGIHLDKDGQPFALVTFGEQWSLTASHECLEMLADPFGSRLIAGKSPAPKQGRVEFLVEVCDPSESPQFAYTVNGIVVSDFYTPSYFDPLPAAGVRYSFTGALTEPRQVAKGGYLSWHHPPSDHWFQQDFFTNKLRIRDLGILAESTQSIRAQIDKITSAESTSAAHSVSQRRHLSAMTTAHATEPATSSKAAAWRTQVKALLAEQRK